jgi:dimethylhistidine N-methyltransferase
VTARTSIGIAQDVVAGRERDQFAADVRYYLVQDPRQLPSRYLYDALGSALFEAICHLPWYGITRAESRLLAAHAPEILRRLESLSAIVELGPGSGEKLRTLLERAAHVPARLDIHLVDVSPTALQASRETLGSVAGVRVIEHATSYEAGLAEAARQATTRGRSLVLFLGSNIGNFDPPGAAALLRSIRQTLTGGDALLLGADLVKPAWQLRLAYDDPLGVTAAFNRNLLVRINRELRGDFAVEEFAHEAVWNLDASRVEMHLVARRPQHVAIPGAGIEITFEAGERIWTESSYKYHPDRIVNMLRAAGFRVAEQWIEPDAAFALTLGEAT